MIAAGVILMKVFVGFREQSEKLDKDSGNLIMEAMINIRTATSFGEEACLEHLICHVRHL